MQAEDNTLTKQVPVVSITEALRRLTAPGAPFAMEETEVFGQTLRTYAQAPSHLRQVFENCLTWQERPYIHFEGEVLTFGDVYRDSNALAAALQKQFGVAKGDRVAICMRNFPEWAVAFWALILLGAIVVPVNAWGTPSEMAYVIEHSGAGIIIADGERLERLRHHFDQLGTKAVIAVRAPGSHGPLVHAFDALIHVYRGSFVSDPGLDSDDDATILYTSGTTGRPKGAVSSHRNIIVCVMNGAFNGAYSHMRATGQLLSPDPAGPQATYLSGVPLFHVGGCNSGLVASMAGGIGLVLMHRWDAGKALDLIETLRLTGIGGVPTMFWQLLEHPHFDRHDLSSLLSVAIGGAAAGPELFARLRERLPGAVPVTGYGATETSGGCTFHSGLDYAAKPASVGIPAPVVDVKCVDPNGLELPRGTAGELCFRGPGVLRGYWKDPASTFETFRDGWFHSGDIGYIDAEGRVTLLDRAKDMVIRGGENVYSIEVENALLAHPDVMAAAVFGIPDPILGEEVVAVVQTRPGIDLSPAALQQLASTTLARFKIPSQILITQDDLPKNETGKILKRDLRQRCLLEMN